MTKPPSKIYGFGRGVGRPPGSRSTSEKMRRQAEYDWLWGKGMSNLDTARWLKIAFPDDFPGDEKTIIRAHQRRKKGCDK